jgi:nicotinamide-nucleotide amidase
MEEVAGLALRERGLRVATAESCTGGLVGHRLTNVPGSSAWVMGGVVAYANEAKESLLGVRGRTLAEHGAVSAETAGEMATGVRRALGAELGLAITGIAGPDGGTPEKPVGTVCFGLASEGGTVSARYQLWGTRDWVKLLASQVALDWLRRHALDLDMTESRVLRRR